ncbi:MAG: hypothetical protein AUJ04_00880 [Acidobacteria bacterium 13_1_40CM_3_55_6]|nr:MAG: hypothetical protein AUJ04_00880 [Acidobacteria bacterium 13_1_40CM_3_55_6]
MTSSEAKENRRDLHIGELLKEIIVVETNCARIVGRRVNRDIQARFELPVLKETLQTSANALSIMSGYKSARVKPMGCG